MKVLLFEYITGGGFNQQELPTSLLREGQLMLNALLDNFAQLPDIELCVMVDSRLVDLIALESSQIVVIGSEKNSHTEFARLAQDCDAVWPIAPEFEGILHTLCSLVPANTRLLSPSAAAVELAGNKYLTFQRLMQHGIATPPTQWLHEAVFYPGEWIVKAHDGAGCEGSFIVTNEAEFIAAQRAMSLAIIQPHLHGAKTSLSCLFKHGKAWLLSVNLQHFTLLESRYRLTAITVNYQQDNGDYQKLADAVASAIPELLGYAGIDLLESDGQQRVLEINPRLTTSFTGLKTALGINVAEQVLRLQQSDPELIIRQNRQVQLVIAC